MCLTTWKRETRRKTATRTERNGKRTTLRSASTLRALPRITASRDSPRKRPPQYANYSQHALPNAMWPRPLRDEPTRKRGGYFRPIPFSRSRPPLVKNPRKTTSKIRSLYGGLRRRHAKPKISHTCERASSPDRSLLITAGPSNLRPRLYQNGNADARTFFVKKRPFPATELLSLAFTA